MKEALEHVAEGGIYESPFSELSPKPVFGILPKPVFQSSPKPQCVTVAVSTF